MHVTHTHHTHTLTATLTAWCAHVARYLLLLWKLVKYLNSCWSSTRKAGPHRAADRRGSSVECVRLRPVTSIQAPICPEFAPPPHLFSPCLIQADPHGSFPHFQIHCLDGVPQCPHNKFHQNIPQILTKHGKIHLSLVFDQQEARV